MIHCLKTSSRNRAILCDYLAREATRWSDQERHDAQEKYNYRMRRNDLFDGDDIGIEVDNQM